MRAALYRGPRQMAITEMQRPVPGDEDVVIKVANCGVCGSDLHFFAAELEQLPTVGGHEIAGEIVEVGSRVPHLAPGDRVAVEPIVRCGHCRNCRLGRYNLCDEYGLIGLQVNGGFAEYVVVPAYTVHHLPSSLSFEEGAAIEPLAVALHGVRMVDVGEGDSVVVLGSGTIGLLSVAAARVAGARVVIATAKFAHQAAAAEEFGATHVISSNDSSLGETVRRLLDGRGADVVVETVGGAAPTIQQALQIVQKGGRVALVGVFSSPQTLQPNLVVRREVSLLGAYCYNFSGPRRDFEVALDLAASGQVSLGRILTHRFKLAQIQQAFDTAIDKTTKAIKVTVEM